MKIAIVGATGAVGQEFGKILSRRKFPVDWDHFYLLGSSRSAGKKRTVEGREFLVHELTDAFFAEQSIDIAFFSAGATVSKEIARRLLRAHNALVIIDNSSAFRMDEDVPLVIPEINGASLASRQTLPESRLIAVPNCSTIIMLMALGPLIQENRLQKIIVSTYQAASGAGSLALQELVEQSRHVLSSEVSNAVAAQANGAQASKPSWQFFPQILAFNAISHNSAIDPKTGLNVEEAKMIEETKKILHDPTIEVYPTCIRIPTFRAHAESIYVELELAVEITDLRQKISRFPGLELCEDYAQNGFPMPRSSSGSDAVSVGRLRYAGVGAQRRKALQLWCAGDQLLKGAALNAVQIAETLLPHLPSISSQSK